MSKEKFVRNKPHCNIGTIGHVDHGKTLDFQAACKNSILFNRSKKKEIINKTKLR